jgi:acylphosphatase
MPSELVTAGIIVSGRVQGVGYRFFTESTALRLGIKGWSKNLPDGRVQLEVEGSRDAVLSFIEELKVGPRMARVSSVEVDWMPHKGRYENFYITF